jgi:predicted transcriptional regulator
MKLQDVMITEVIQASPDDSVGDAAKRMREKAVGCLVVTIAGAVKGIVTDRDLLDCLAESHDPFRCPLSAHMNRPVIILGPEEDHKMAAKVLQRKKIRRLPVAQRGKLLGIISLSDLAAIAGQEAEELRSSSDFIAEVIGLQSAQTSRIQLKRPAEPPAAPDERTRRLEVLDNGNKLIDAGSPG